MAITYRNYTLNSLGEDPWYNREIKLFEDIIDRIPADGSRLVTAEHIHYNLVNPNTLATVVTVSSAGVVGLPTYPPSQILGTDSNSNIVAVTSITGLQGVTGISGGTTGIQGETGVAGATGVMGFSGEQGIQGATGIQGQTGVQGGTGIQGQTGVASLVGLTKDYLPKSTSTSTLIDSSCYETAGFLFIDKTINGAVGAGLNIRQDSASPAQNDQVASVNLYGKNSVNGWQPYGAIKGLIADPTGGAEQGAIGFYSGDYGGVSERLRIDNRYGSIIYNSQLRGGDTAQAWDANEIAGYGIPTGCQGLNNSEVGEQYRVSNIAIDKGGLLVQAQTNKSDGIGIKVNAYSSVDPATNANIVLNGAQLNSVDPTQGLTGIPGTSKLLSLRNNATEKAYVTGNGSISCAALTCTTLTSDNIGKEVSLTLNATGFAAATQVTAIVTLLGNKTVNLFIPVFDASSNSTSMSLSDLGIYSPVSPLYPLAYFTDNGSASVAPAIANWMQIANTGSIICYKTSSSGFTANNSKGLSAPISVTYRIA
jgi:hypothetical protein